MKILFIGDVVGSPGRSVLARLLPHLKSELDVGFVIVNGENAAAGRGPNPEIAEALLNAGADVITLGDHAFDSREMVSYIATQPRVLRPANFPPGAPGRGWYRQETPEGDVAVMALVGRTFMNPNDCPFRAADDLLKPALGLGRAVFVDMHAEATSEKIAMGRYLDGRVAAVVGTHTHVQTSDEEILEGGTAYITDLGMTGPKASVIGREYEPVLAKFVTGVPQKFSVEKKKGSKLEGVLIDTDLASGRSRSIRRIRIDGE